MSETKEKQQFSTWRLWNWIEALSIRMINRRTTMDGIKRHYWSNVKKELIGLENNKDNKCF